MLFPILPTRKFAVKALIQGLLTSAGIAAYFILTGGKTWLLLASIITVTLGYNLFFGATIFAYGASTGLAQKHGYCNKQTKDLIRNGIPGQD